MISNLWDYREAGFRLFGLHGVDSSGVCGCGDPECKTLFKHPVISRWQSVPEWSDEQMKTFEEDLGWFNTGFGVLCKGWLIVDVDARNGGVESFGRLLRDVPEVGQAAFVVATGSGGGSAHHYFKIDEQVAIAQHLDSYPGIDFKSSGYVVGAGSLHASGGRYETIRGFPQDITEAPSGLVDLLKKPERVRVSTDGGEVDIDQERIIDLLEYIDSAAPYEKWTAVGMAIHHCLKGSDAGLQIWINWTAKKQHDAQAYRLSAQNLYKRWHTFGKSGNPVGFGTLMQYAREGGYSEPVTFVYEGEVPESGDGVAEDLPPVDLKRPPGWVGELTGWINAQCLYPAENLAVAAALTAVSSIAGMRHEDELDNISPNLMAFCIAGSGTGKESVINAYLEIMGAAGCTPAIYGAIKSSQEIVRNFLEHQLAAYCYDEMGFFLSKLQSASKRGGALYLEEVIGLIMSAYSKPNGYLPISGDLKRDTRDKLLLEAGRIQKRIDALPADSSSDEKQKRMESDHERVMEAVNTIDMGIKSPFMTFIGFSNPEEFKHLMDGRMARNGFLARAVMFQELETNPRRKKNFRKKPMDDGLKSALLTLYAPGRFDMLEGSSGRIQHTGERTSVSSTDEAVEAMEAAYERFHAMAEEQKQNTSLEAIPRRGYEMTAKVSMILAIPSGVRTLEHVVWAEALARRDCEAKINMAAATEKQETAEGVAARILTIVDIEHGETAGVIRNRVKSKGFPAESVDSLLAQMEKIGLLKSEVVTRGKDAGKGKKYFATDKGKKRVAD